MPWKTLSQSKKLKITKCSLRYTSRRKGTNWYKSLPNLTSILWSYNTPSNICRVDIFLINKCSKLAGPMIPGSSVFQMHRSLYSVMLGCSYVEKGNIKASCRSKVRRTSIVNQKTANLGETRKTWEAGETWNKMLIKSPQMLSLVEQMTRDRSVLWFAVFQKIHQAM